MRAEGNALITKSDGFYQIILFFRYLAGVYPRAWFFGGHMGTERDRVISISLSEAEWQALVARHPQPVTWLRDRIRETVGTSDQSQSAKSAA